MFSHHLGRILVELLDVEILDGLAVFDAGSVAKHARLRHLPTAGSAALLGPSQCTGRLRQPPTVKAGLLETGRTCDESATRSPAVASSMPTDPPAISEWADRILLATTATLRFSNPGVLHKPTPRRLVEKRSVAVAWCG